MNQMEKVALQNVAEKTGFNLIRSKKLLIEEMRKAMTADEVEAFWEEDRGGFLPDSWVFLADQGSEGHKIIAIEIEDNSKITIPKLKKYADFWWSCEFNYIDLELRIYDKYGQFFNEFDIPGFSFAMDIEGMIPEDEKFFPPEVRARCFVKGYWEDRLRSIGAKPYKSISELVMHGVALKNGLRLQ